jgi:predicted RND superfamily exporter protein
MARGGWLMLVLGLGILAAALGLGKLRFNPDILSMLPPEMPEVRGLKAFHDGFARQNELLLLIEGGEDDKALLAEAAESLTGALEASGAVRRARWRQQWEEQGAGLSELLAYLWLNGPPEIAAGQAARFTGPLAEPALEEALARVATAMEGEDMVMRANDPFGFLRHPSLAVLSAMAEDGDGGFESPDGRAHLVVAEAADALHGYREAGEFLHEVSETIARWQQDEGAGLSVRITGEPAFAAEIGGAMENDMRGTVGITALLIGILFWIVQRRFSLLAGLGGVLGLVFISALGLAGWIFGELSIMAAGFAAILIGLTVDYGVLICQEAKQADHDRRALLGSTGRSILWAAATTAVVFLALNLSSLPGIAQLGTTVAVGIVAGALIMLGLYLPWVARLGAGRASRPRGRGGALPDKAVAGLTVLVAAAASGVLIWQGVPGIEFDSRMMRPRHSEAMAAFDRVQAVFPRWDSGDLQLILEADDDSAMHDRLETARARTDALGGKIVREQFPDGWWPDAASQHANQAPLRTLAADAGRLLALADQVGFADDGLALGRAVFGELARMTGEPLPVFPRSDAARDMTRMFVSRDDSGGGSLLARITPADDADPAGADHALFRELSGDGIWLTGWSLLRPAVSPLVRQDLVRVFLPMAVLMIVMLAVIFRRPGDVGRILLAMALSGLVLLATMAGLGIGWNFLNIAATPLLLGTGIDYGIHVMLALRRNGGNLAAMWHGTGKAVLFCGCSTAIGFGSLCFASNDAMASLGTVAVIGILASTLVSVFLLPGWSRRTEKVVSYPKS